MTHRTGFRVLVIAIPVLAATLLMAAALPDKSAWPCDERMYIHGDGGGDATETKALERAASILADLAPGFTGSASEASLAVHSTSGPDRYDSSTGYLYVDDYVAPRFFVEEREDGTFSVGQIETCAP